MRKICLTVVCLVVISLGLFGCGGGKQSAVTPAPAKQVSVKDLFAKAKTLPDMSYDFSMVAEDLNMQGKSWISGKKMKSELTIEGEKTVTIIDGDAKVSYLYYPDKGTAMKTAYDEKTAQAVPSSKQILDEMDPAQVKDAGTVTYEGVKCRLLIAKDPGSKAESKMWIWEDYGVLLRLEGVDSDGGKLVMEHKNIKMGAPPADAFQLPAGVKVTDMADMMKDMQKR